MEKRIKKSQTLYSLSFILFFICIICLSSLGLWFPDSYLFSCILILSIIALIAHCFYVSHLKSLLLTLIKMTQMIIDQKDDLFPVIDGESYIAVLSSHLHLLNQRMQGMIAYLNLEKQNLKIFIEDISHQIKTPLTAMFLKEDILLEITNGQQHQIVEQIIFQTEQIHHYIESLLHLAQLESQTIVYHKKEYMFDELLNSIQEHLLPLMEKHDVSFCIQNEKQMIYCDFQWMSEALENILKNCIEQIDHSHIHISYQQQSSYNKIIIHDHGKGFLPEDIPHIFERFYRNQYQNHQGIGIGLSITKQIIEDHHGTIQINNDQGAVFEILLPQKETKSKYPVTI
jgi:signal transduction histidine kinase